MLPRLVVALLLSLPTAAAASTLALTGACGGTMSLDAAGLTADGAYVILVAPDVGSASIPAGAPTCGGVVTGLQVIEPLSWGTADGTGAVSLTQGVPAAGCGASVQVLDVASCTLTNVATVAGADADGDGFTALTDCDDADPTVYPGAPRLCDGVRNDCDDAGWTDDGGVVTFFAADGTHTDYTGVFASDSIRTFTTSGTLRFCDGSYAGRIDFTGATSDVAIESLNGPAVTQISSAWVPMIDIDSGGSIRVEGLTLDGGGVEVRPSAGFTTATFRDLELLGPVNEVDFNDLYAAAGAVALQDVVVRGGGMRLIVGSGSTATVVGVDLIDPTAPLVVDGGFGGAATVTLDDVQVTGASARMSLLYVDATVTDLLVQDSTDPNGVMDVKGSTLHATRLTLRDNVGGNQGQLDAEQSDVTLVDSTLSGNISSGYGGAIMGTGGSLTLLGSTVTGNAAQRGGGLWSSGPVVLIDTLIADNTASQYGGGAHVNWVGSIACTRTTGTAGFLRNTATLKGGGVYLDRSDLQSNACDWGTGGNDNSADDVYHYGSGVNQSFWYGDDATFTCTAGMPCTP